MADQLRVVILKPSKYRPDGYVERFRWGFMPNSTVPYMRSMTPAGLGGTQVEVHTIDEYVHTDLGYLSLLERPRGGRTLLALVGVQSHQFHRALDLAAYARRNGCLAVIGGPHVMTCDTSMLHGRGVSFALAEAELVWREILEDAVGGELRPVYGADGRWQQELEAPVVVPPGRQDLRRYVIPMLGLYPARGCPFTCNFCSVIKIAGRRIRSQSVATTLASLRAAKAGGVRTIMFTSDNFNKYPEAEELLSAIVEERLGLEFFVQCDTQIARQERLVALLAEAGCFQMFVGVESFNRQTLLAARKGQNRPEMYRDIVRLCREHGISSHFSNIIGFPQDTEGDVDAAPGNAPRAGPDVRLLLHPLPDSRHRAVRRVRGRGAGHRGQPRPVRHDVPDLAPPPLLARAVGRVAVSVLSQVLLVGPRGAQLDAPGLAQKWCAGGVGGDHGHVAVQSVLHVEADPSHVRRGHARAAGPRGRVPPAAQGRVRLRAGSATAQPAIGGGGQLAEPGHQSACAGEFSTRNRPVSPSLIRSSSRGPIVHEPGMDTRSKGRAWPRDGRLAQRPASWAVPAWDWSALRENVSVA